MTGGSQWYSALRQRGNKAFRMVGNCPTSGSHLGRYRALGLCFLEPSTAPARLGPLGVWWDFLICIFALFLKCQIKDRIRVSGSDELPGAQGTPSPPTESPLHPGSTHAPPLPRVPPFIKGASASAGPCRTPASSDWFCSADEMDMWPARPTNPQYSIFSNT